MSAAAPTPTPAAPTNPWDTAAQEPPTRKEFFDLYQVALAEYRFQVLFNWERTKHDFAFIATILGAAMGLLKLGNSAVVDVLVAAFFGVAARAAGAGIATIDDGKDYYRRVRAQKAFIEYKLGLFAPSLAADGRVATLALTTTEGQLAVARHVADPGTYSAPTAGTEARPRRQNITTRLSDLLTLMRYVAFAGVVLWLVHAGYNLAVDRPWRLVRPTTPPSVSLPAAPVVSRPAG